MTRNPKIFLSLTVSILASGCSNYSNSFDCPIGKGLNCTPLSVVNDKIDRQEIDLSFTEGKQEDSSFWGGLSSSCADCNKTSLSTLSQQSFPQVHWRKRP
jgi:hypothetical protein